MTLYYKYIDINGIYREEEANCFLKIPDFIWEVQFRNYIGANKLHCVNGPALYEIVDEEIVFNHYYLFGDFITKDKWIWDRKYGKINKMNKENLVPFLLDDNSLIRYIAEQRLKELEDET